MPTELNHILKNEELVEQLMAHLDSDRAAEELERGRIDTGRLKGSV